MRETVEKVDERREPPEYHREMTAAMAHLVCRLCGVRYHWHFDGWDGNRLDCEEAKRRAGQ